VRSVYITSPHACLCSVSLSRQANGLKRDGIISVTPKTPDIATDTLRMSQSSESWPGVPNFTIINLSFYVIFERYVIRLLRIWNNLMAHRKMVQVNYTFREIICSKIFNVAKTSLISELELKKNPGFQYFNRSSLWRSTYLKIYLVELLAQGRYISSFDYKILWNNSDIVEYAI